ncbi:MAG: glycosyltransferase [Pelomonas sp.]|nr:glycosyltransferase [Roseateles sp.]
MSAPPLITALVSTYSAERFIRGCLDDLVAQSALDALEILVVDSGSPQGEGAICADYARRYPQIRLIRTEREQLYAAWNRAIGLARGTYLTSANTDDRHHPCFVERMIGALDANPRAGLAYADQYLSPTENETFEACAQRGATRLRRPDYTPAELLIRCITGSQPVWRRALHERHGRFDTRYRIAADYDMWLRIARHHELLHVAEPLGVFYDSPDTLSGARNHAQMYAESLDIQRACLQESPWREQPGLRGRLAAELFGRGYRFVRGRQRQAAAALMREAIRLDPSNAAFRKTYFLRCVLGIPTFG